MNILLRWLASLLLLVACGPVLADSVIARTECGFGLIVCGPEQTFEQGADPVNFQFGFEPEANPTYTAAYVGNTFVLTANFDNDPLGATPYGIAIYPDTAPVPAYGCEACRRGFIAFYDFPTQAGEQFVVELAPVPEPAAAALLAAGLLVVAAARRRAGRAHSTFCGAGS